MSELRPVKYLVVGEPDWHKRVYIEEREQRDGSILWAVTQTGWTLNHDREWEYEPIPSSRDEEYTKRCRFASIAEALTFLPEAA